MLRQAAERAAVNAPIQGTAADIVKVAMVSVDQALREKMPDVRLLLQVHDELLFEVPAKHSAKLIELVQPLMENAVKLAVPVVVDVGQGLSWAEAH
jgi:DNA polymerase-1